MERLCETNETMSKLGSSSLVRGGTSGVRSPVVQDISRSPLSPALVSDQSASEIEEDSSDVESNHSEEEQFLRVLSRRQQKILRGKSLKAST